MVVTTLERLMKMLAALTLALSGAVVAVAAPSPEFMNVAALAETGAPFAQAQVIGGVTYLNGGASLDEVAYVKSHAGEYSLQILFSGRGGEYGVADTVSVRNGQRELLSVPDAGPYLMMKLPPGRYTVEATFKGAAEQRVVTVGNGLTKLNWNTPKASD
jgi:hypothetical protein